MGMRTQGIGHDTHASPCSFPVILTVVCQLQISIESCKKCIFKD